jgi:hypothetical protein
MVGEEFSERRISEFNEAVFQIQRLNSIWIECKLRRQRGDIPGVMTALDNAAIELWVDAAKIDSRDKNEVGYQKKITALDKEMEYVIEQKDIKSLRNLYKLEIIKEKLLRQLQEDAGKGGKTKLEDDEWGD